MKRSRRHQLATCLPAQVGLPGVDREGLALSCFHADCSDRIQLLGCIGLDEVVRLGLHDGVSAVVREDREHPFFYAPALRHGH